LRLSEALQVFSFSASLSIVPGAEKDRSLPFLQMACVFAGEAEHLRRTTAKSRIADLGANCSEIPLSADAVEKVFVAARQVL
jgi:hypothetical protein